MEASPDRSLPCGLKAPPLRSGSRIVAVLLAASVALIGCGGDVDGEGRSGGSAPPKVAETAGFPNPSSRSLRDLIANMPRGPALTPSVSLLEPGRSRFAFALFDRGNRQIGDLKVALYVAKGLDETARGPYPVAFEQIEVAPRFRSKQTIDDPDAARSLYVSEIPLGRAGGYAVSAVAALDKKLVATSPAQIMVSDRGNVPASGDRAIRVHTPTRESVGGDLKSIETRIPPDSMHEIDLAEALDQHRPVLLLFSTPALCQSRVCGPVTDVTEQVKSQLGDRVAFIHMEVYKDNDPGKGLRPQLRAWRLRTEPFAFAIDSSGTVVERLEGAFNVSELEAAVRKALR